MTCIRAVIVTCVIVLGMSPRAHAWNRYFSTTVEGGRGLLYMQSAHPSGRGTLAFSIKTFIMEKESYSAGQSGGLSLRKDYPSVTAVPLSFGLTDEIDLTASFYGFHDTRFFANQSDVFGGYSEPETGYGATRLAVKLRLPLRKDSPIQIAGKFGAMLDTSGNVSEGLNYRWLNKGTDIETSLYETLAIGRHLSLSLEQGYVLSGSNVYDDQFVIGAGLQVFTGDRLTFNVEINNRTFNGVGPRSVLQAGNDPDRYRTVNGVPAVGNPAFVMDEDADFAKDFLIATPSVAVRVNNNISGVFGVNLNLADQASPRERIQFVAGITIEGVIDRMIDTDGDGINDHRDREPATPAGFPVDADGVALDSDLDGVPNGRDDQPETPFGARTDAAGVGIDTDKDGVYDGLDREPESPAGAIVDTFGVALDSDDDGVPDILDMEQGTPREAVVDVNGVAVDSDGDGVPDGPDREPYTVAGNPVDEFGVALDSDLDGVPDGEDLEPDTPAGVLVDKQGRGLHKRGLTFLSEGLLTLNTVQFAPGSAVLLPQSYDELNELGSMLVKYKDIRVQIEGHTDNTGDRRSNLELSRDRAVAVRDYLLTMFPDLDRSRLRAVGFGPDKPVAPNTSFQGRIANRRVDFVIINRDQLLTR